MRRSSAPASPGTESRCRRYVAEQRVSSNLFLWLTRGSLHLNVTSRQSINNERGADPS